MKINGSADLIFLQIIHGDEHGILGVRVED